MNTFHSALSALVLTALTAFVPVALARAGGPGLTEPDKPWMGWVFDEGSGTITIDRFGLQTGTLENFSTAPWGSPGPFLYPFNFYRGFDGINDRVVVSEGGILASRPTSTVSAWFKFPMSPAPRQHVIYSERDMCEFNIFWLGIELRPGSMPGLTFAIYDSTSPACGSGFWHTLTHPFVPTDGGWHHIAGTLEPGAGMKLYFDGALVGTLPGIPPYLGGVQSKSTIGHSHTVGAPNYWSGIIDEVGLFGYALTPPEVAWLHAHSLTEIAQWTFDGACFGDGSGTACPCSNEGPVSWEGGCKNSRNVGAQLTVRGSPRTSFDSATLTVLEMTIGAPCLFFQGTALVNGGAGITFGDGLLCVGGTITRLGVKFSTDHFAYLPHAGDPTLSVLGLVPGGGGERYYQAWYRDAADYCSSSTYNLTNAVRVPWGI
ncbi:MAG: LamG domain-containing protein [Planctomycetes bacterium]|nr:LamG domain-containing protein [Planctomycetota bacterium]